MYFVAVARAFFRQTWLAFLFAAMGIMLQFACGGGRSSIPPPLPAPSITQFTAAKSPITFGNSTSLSAVFSNGTGSIIPGAITVLSDAPVTVSPQADTTYTLTVTNSAGVTATATASILVVAAPGVPMITAPNVVTAGMGGYTASVPDQVGMTLTWSIANGTITSGVTGTSITFTAGTSGTVDLSCIATNAAGTSSAAGVATVTVVAAPVATSLVAATSPVMFGGSTTITPTFSGGVGTISNGIGTVSSGSVYSTGAITASKTFTLTVTNGAGTTATTSVTVTPQTVSVGAISPANPTKTVSTSTTFSSTATGGATNGITWSASAGSMNPSTGAWIAPASGQSATIMATSADDPTKSASTTVTVVGLPVATSLVATTNPALFGGSTVITPTFSGGTGVVDQGIGTVTSGTGFSSGSITASKTFTLTVTNGAGATATTTMTVTPQTVSVGAISPANPTKTVSTSTTFGATVTGGSTNGITWSASAGSMNPSTGAWTAPATAQSVTITATSADDPTKAATTAVTVVAAPTVPTITVQSSVTASQAGYTASVPAQAGMSFSWNLTNAAITAGQGTASITFTPGTSGSVDLSCTATNAANMTATGTASSTIVPLPTISILSANNQEVISGGASTLSYTFSGGTGSIDHAVGSVTSGGTTVVHPANTTTYTLTVTSPSGSTTTDTVTITVSALPTISNLQASSSTITSGQGVILTYTFTGDGAIDQGVGSVTTDGQIAVAPTATTTYTLTATNLVGATTTATVTVTVKSFTGKFVYVANAGGGISGFAMNDATGALTELGGSPFDAAVSALHVTSDPAGKFLFVVNGDGVVNANTLTVYSINQSTGDLTNLASYATDTDPWTSAVDPSGKFVYVRCDGFIDAFSLDGTTGGLTPMAIPSVATTGGSGEVAIHPSGKLLFVVGRTSDKLQVYDLDSNTGAISLNASYDVPAGTGPLSLALSHSGEYLFTKSEGASGSAAQDCLVYGYYVDITTGGLSPLSAFDTGLQESDAYHGVSGNPTLPVIYITLVNSTNDFAAYALNVDTGVMTPLSGTTYDLFGAAGSDSLVVSRNGKWGILTDYNSSQIAVCSVNPATGVLTAPTFVPVGLFPVSVTVVGSVQ